VAALMLRARPAAPSEEPVVDEQAAEPLAA